MYKEIIKKILILIKDKYKIRWILAKEKKNIKSVMVNDEHV